MNHSQSVTEATSPVPATHYADRCYCRRYAPGHAPGLHGTWITCVGDLHMTRAEVDARKSA